MPAADDILTLREVAAALRLDPRTVRLVASDLGGRRLGSRWRFRWGTVMECFNAYATETSEQRMGRPCDDQWPRGGKQNLSTRPEEWAGMARGTKLEKKKKKFVKW